jgi:hypothetical protein
MVKAILNKKYLTVQKDDDGELLLEFPDDLLDTMNWEPGDTIIWTELPNGNGYNVEKAKTYER